ncbi:MAG: hypothetical protein RLZZ558_1715 [Planctomycetota bacterium]|jgi:hypothetical protein
MHHRALALAALLAAVPASGQGLILNEYNGVGSTKFLEINFTDIEEGFDSHFGRVLGNGGNWIELVVTQDHLDVRGWTLEWVETLKRNRPGDPNAVPPIPPVIVTNGQSIWFPDGDVLQGTVTFADHPAWSNLRRGTILTICEFGQDMDVAEGDRGKDVDFTFDPCRGDWWINAVTMGHPELFSTSANNINGGPGTFTTGNDGWYMVIRDAQGNIRQDQRGEGGVGWGGSGVNSQEVGKLKGPPSEESTNLDWDDSDVSNFGHPNAWGDLLNPLCRAAQDFAPLRAEVLAECQGCTPLFLNEYNAVAAGNFLNGGSVFADDDGGTASDAFLGRVAGNGGHWLELVVGADNLDIRGWTLAWSEQVEGGNAGTITLADNPALAALPAGTIVTVIRNNAAQGGRDTDLELNAATGDNWINLWSGDASVIASTTSSARRSGFGSFITSANRWRLEILDGSGNSVAGPFGAGSGQYWRTPVSDTRTCALRMSPDRLVTMADDFDAVIRSTFGQENAWVECPDFGSDGLQDLSMLGGCSFEPACNGDLDQSGTVDAGDIGTLLLLFGQAGGPGDLDASGMVDAGDIGVLLILFGPCG